ncbi:hypothetical protein BS50DRAFT_291887 [Corynespora cassiicola Philippines]|uniref:Uncharacterized protein n=1 Tax=Corynespora cassiicola Philippines TaxID=1448308 RepID=A0A2T2NW35_CORCC|nr:hypothetical protein BS50DRAFT_291887 [Corynespora cassiicola Philippines]
MCVGYVVCVYVCGQVEWSGRVMEAWREEVGRWVGPCVGLLLRPLHLSSTTKIWRSAVLACAIGMQVETGFASSCFFSFRATPCWRLLLWIRYGTVPSNADGRGEGARERDRRDSLARRNRLRKSTKGQQEEGRRWRQKKCKQWGGPANIGWLRALCRPSSIAAYWLHGCMPHAACYGLRYGRFAGAGHILTSTYVTLRGHLPFSAGARSSKGTTRPGSIAMCCDRVLLNGMCEGQQTHLLPSTSNGRTEAYAYAIVDFLSADR